MVFNVLWLTSVICWTGRVAAHCTGFPNYCSLRRVQQIYGQWEKSSIPTITPGTRIKLTICNLNRLNTCASREKHNQPGRGPEEINSKTLWLASSSHFLFFAFLLSPLPPIFLLSLTGRTLHSLTLWHSLTLTALFLISGPLSVSLFNTLTSYSTEISIIKGVEPFAREWAPAIQYGWLKACLSIESYTQPFFPPPTLHPQTRPMTSLSRCSHSGPCPASRIHGYICPQL